MMSSALPDLCVVSRSDRPCTSNHCLFHVDELPHLVFCAHAVEGGTLVLQQAYSGLHQLDPAPVPVEQHQPYWLHYLGTGQPQQPQQTSSSGGVQDPFSTVLIINDVRSHGDEPIQQLVWGGGPHHLLAAASKHCISIFSLRPFMASLSHAQEAAVAGTQQQHTPQQILHPQQQQQHTPLQPVPELPSQQQQQQQEVKDELGASRRKRQRCCYHPSIGYIALPTYHLGCQLLGLQWTSDATGLLLADVVGNIIMLQITCRQQQRQHQGSSEPAAAEPFLQQQQQEDQLWQLRELWRVQADTAQHLIAAGAWPTGPAATVSSDNGQRVIIWWPSPDPKGKGGGAFKVGAEVIRHPVTAVQLQWSPPLPRSSSSGARDSGSGGNSAGGAAGGSGGGVAAGAAGAKGALPPGAPAAGQGGSEGQPAAAAAGTQQTSSSSSEAGGGSWGQPALMTVGVDGIIRVFVEVVLSDIGPGPPAAPAGAAAGGGGGSSKSSSSTPAGSSPGPATGKAGATAAAAAAAVPAATMSQFCLTLVIDPPGLGPSKGLGFKPGLTVTWARPLANPAPQQPQLLWLLGSYIAPHPQQQPLPLAAALSGVSAQAAAAAGGFMPGGMQGLQPPPPAAAAAAAAVESSSAGAGSSQGAAAYQDHVMLWAVDGLAGVVLSGIATNAIMSNKVSEPRAYLWGRDSSSLSWQRPQLLLQQAAQAHNHQHQHHRLQQQQLQHPGSSGGGGGAVGSPRSTLGPAQWGVGFSHSLGAWVVESPAGPLLSVLQQYHAPLAATAAGSASLGWPGLGLLQAPDHAAAAAAAGSAAQPGAASAPPCGPVSEARSYQVTPLTGVNEAGHPSSAIAVAPTSSRATEGPCEEWVQVSIHTAADLAAAVSSSGAVAIWSLCPVQLLPVASRPEPQQQQQQQQQRGTAASSILPASWFSCKTCCWLSFGGATAAAAASAAGLSGLPLLLAVHAGSGIDICLVMLSNSSSAVSSQPGRQQQHKLSSSSSSSSSGHVTCVTGVHVLLHLDTPAGLTGVKQLVELGACQVPVPVAAATQEAADSNDADQQQRQQPPLILQATLLGLGGYDPSRLYEAQQQQQQEQEHALDQQQQQQQPHHVMQRLLSDGDRLDVPGQDAWVSWTLEVCLQHNDQQQQQHPGQEQQGPFAAAGHAAAAAAGGGYDSSCWPLQLHASRPTVTPTGDAVTAARLTAAAAVGAAGAAAAASASAGAAVSAGEELRAAVTCLQCPSPASPFIVTGNASGMLMLWQAAAPGSNPAKAAADHQHSPSEAAAAGAVFHDGGDNDKGASTAAPSGAEMRLLQASGCSVGGVNLGGICVAVALCASAGYAAAAVTCGQSELEDAVFIWCAEGTTHSSSTTSSSTTTSTAGSLSPRATPPHSTTPSSNTSSSSSAGGPFALDCLLPLDDTAASLAWLDTGGLPPLLAVGAASGLVEVYSRDRSGQWNTLACYEVGLSVNFIAANRLGLPVLVAGSQLLLLSNLAALHTTTGAHRSSSNSNSHHQQAAITAAAGEAAEATSEAPSAAIAAAAGWDDASDDETTAAAEGGGGGVSSSLLGIGNSSSSQGSSSSSWALVNLCQQLQQVQPLKLPAGPAQGAWLSDSSQVLATHAALAAAAGSSSLPLYHPDVLLLLLGQGRLAAAAHVIRCVLKCVLLHRAGKVGGSKTTSSPDAQLAGAAAAAGGGWGGSSSGSSSGGAHCSVPLEALLGPEAQQGALLDADALRRCCSFRDAVTAAALGHTSTTAPAAAAAAGAGAGAVNGGSTAASAVTKLSAVSTSTAAAAASAADDWGPLKPAAVPAAAAAVGGGGGGGGGAAAAVASSGAAALDTGMLDMSAFGGFGGFGGGADDGDDWGQQPATATGQQQQQEASGRTQQPAAAAAAAAPNALETGMLDMSAFGDFGGGFGGSGEDEQQQQHTAPQTSSSSSAAAAAGGPSHGPADPLATGMLDMSAFGFGTDVSENTPAGHDNLNQQQQQQQHEQSGDGSQQKLCPAAAVTRGPAAQGLPPQLLAKTLVEFPPAPKKTAVIKPGVVAAAGLGGGGGGPGARTAGAASNSLLPQQQLLSRAEVQQLHALLDLPEARLIVAAHNSSSGSGGRYGGAGGSGSSAQAYYSRLLGAAGAANDTRESGYNRSSSSSKGATAQEGSGGSAAKPDSVLHQQQLQHPGDAQVLAMLGLNPGQGQQLCNIAAALSTRTFMGEEGSAADDAAYGAGDASSGATSSGPANAAALAASWASAGADDDDSYNSVNKRWPGGLSRSGSSTGATTAGQSKAPAATADLTIIGAPDSGFNAALFQEVDRAGRLFAVNVQAALLQLAVQVATAPVTTAAEGQQERQRRFTAAVARLFQPVSVSRSHHTAAAQGRKGAALLAHYPAMPVPSAGAAGGADASGGGSSRLQGSRPPLSPSRQQQQQLSSRSAANSGGGSSISSVHAQGLRAGGSGLGFNRTGSSRGLAPPSMRSSMSVASMLSFSSLKNDGSMDGGSDAGSAAVAAAAAAAIQAGSRSWAAFMGLLPGVTPLLCLWGLASSSQAALLQVLLPLVPDDIEQQLAAAGVSAAAVAAEHTHHRQSGGGGGGGSSFASGGVGQEQQVLTWSKLRALGAGLWLTDPTALRSTAEALAKAQYAVAKDPHEPALMYAALGKKSVLQGLFRSTGNKKVADFLARDFTTPDGRAAASKNAFHLLGQHRHHLAAAFFILAGSHWDAVSVLAHDAADPQLGLFVARLLDTAAAAAPGGGAAAAAAPDAGTAAAAAVSLQRRLVDSDLMPLAEADVDPAAAALAAWLRGRDGAAAVMVLLSRMLAAQLLEGLDPWALEPCSADSNNQAGTAAAAAGWSDGSVSGVPGQGLPAAGFTSSPSSSPAPRQGSADTASTGFKPPQQQQQAQQQHHHHNHLSSPSSTVLSQLPLLLHWVLAVGLDQLGGRMVSGSLVAVLHRLALRVARCAEVAGLPVAAAEALAFADVVGDPYAGGGGNSSGSTGMGQPDLLGEVLLLMWHARLAAAVLALQLLPDSAGIPVNAHGTTTTTISSTSSSSSSISVDVAYWSAAVAEATPLLQKLGLKVEPEAVAVVLARHALALNPILALPADPPGCGWCWDLPQQQLEQQADAADAGPDAASRTSSMALGAFGKSSGGSAAIAAAGPDAVLAVCLSRSSSIAPASALASPTLLSRVGSATAPTATGGGAGLNRSLQAAGLASSAAAADRLQSSAGSTGPGWGQVLQQQGSQQLRSPRASSSSSSPVVLGLSWELARQQGDRLAAVSACSGAQFSCCLQQQQHHHAHHHHQLQQQQQREHGDGYGSSAAVAAAGGGGSSVQRASSPSTPRQRMSQPGRSLVRPRPLIFASKAGGMAPAELLAPPNLLSHWTTTHQYRQLSSSNSATAAGSSGSGNTSSSAANGAGSFVLPGNNHLQSPQRAASQQGIVGSPKALSPAAPYDAASSSNSLSGFMSQVLDQLRWPPDPWVIGEYPTRRSGLSLGSAAAVGHVQAATLSAHPNRPLFVSGSSTGRIYLWQFGEANCKAAYVPLASTGQGSIPAKRLASHEAVSTPHWGNPAAVRFSRSGARFGAVGEGGLVGLWRQDCISAVDGMGHAEWLGHCLSRSGTGIAFLGDTGSQVLVSGVGERGGSVVLVDTLAPPTAATAATLVSARGATPTTLCLVPPSGAGGAGAVLVVGDDAGEVRGYDVRLLDDKRPLWSTRQQQPYHLAAAAGSGGGVPSSSSSSSNGGVTSLACWDQAWLGGSSSAVTVVEAAGSNGVGWQQCSLGDLVAAGSRDGSINLLHAHTGACVQQLPCAHYTERKGLLERVTGGLAGGSSRASSGSLDDVSGGGAGGAGGAGGGVVLRARPAGAVPAAVSGLQACAEGLVSCGWDGVVRFSPFAGLLNEWSARAGDGV